jgi:hypothetical protein
VSELLQQHPVKLVELHKKKDLPSDPVTATPTFWLTKFEKFKNSITMLENRPKPFSCVL